MFHFTVKNYNIFQGAITTFLTPEGQKYYECVEDIDMIKLLKRLEDIK